MSSYKEKINELTTQLAAIQYDLVLPNKIFVARIQSLTAIGEMLNKVKESNSPDEVKQFWYKRVNELHKAHELFEEVGDELRLMTGALDFYSNENKALLARVKELEIENDRIKNEYLNK